MAMIQELGLLSFETRYINYTDLMRCMSRLLVKISEPYIDGSVVSWVALTLNKRPTPHPIIVHKSSIKNN